MRERSTHPDWLRQCSSASFGEETALADASGRIVREWRGRAAILIFIDGFFQCAQKRHERAVGIEIFEILPRIDRAVAKKESFVQMIEFALCSFDRVILRIEHLQADDLFGSGVNVKQ